MLSIYIILFSKKLYNDSTKDAKLLFDNPQILLYIYISLLLAYIILDISKMTANLVRCCL